MELKRSSLHPQNFQRMIIILYQTIEEGLTVVSKEEAEIFHKIFFGKVKNEFILASHYDERIEIREGELEPLDLYRFKDGLEASLFYTLALTKEWLQRGE